MIRGMRGRTDAMAVEISFVYDGYLVCIDSDGTLEIYEHIE